MINTGYTPGCRRASAGASPGQHGTGKGIQSHVKARRKPAPSLLTWCTDRVRIAYGYCTDGVRSHLLATPEPPQSHTEAKVEGRMTNAE
jgi:hypothetical protein